MRNKLYLLLLLCVHFSENAVSQILDPGFGQDGLLTLSYQNTNYGSIRWIDDRLYGEIYDYGGINYQFRVFDDNGQPDLSFGTGGAITNAPFGSTEISPDGIYFTNMATSPFKATIKKYTPQGDLNTNFGNSGTIINTISTMNTNIPGWNGIQYGADFIEDDLFLYGKYMDTLCFLKYDTDGNLDQVYGQDGIAKRTMLEVCPSGYSYVTKSLFILNNQWHVQMFGTVTEGDPVLYVARLDANGDWDLSFGTSGLVDMSSYIEVTTNEWGAEVVNTPSIRILNDRVYPMFYDFTSTTTTLRLGRCLLGSFTLDTSFGNEGYITEPSITGYCAPEMDAENRIYLAGQLASSLPAIAACTRFSEDGIQDLSFGQSGILTLEAPIEGNGIRISRISFDNETVYLSGNTGLFGVETGYSELFCAKYGFELPSDLNEENSNNVSIYPNPAKDHVRLLNTGTGTASIYSMDGRLMKTSRLTGMSNDIIDISDLPVGQYILEFSENPIPIKLMKL